MLKMVKAEVAGITCNLFFSNEAMFTISKKYPESQDDLSKAVGTNTPEIIESTIDIFLILAKAGNAALEYYGHGHQKMPEREDFAFLTPGETQKMENAIYAAVILGSDRDVPSLEDTDLYLLEIEREREKKTGTATDG